MKKYIIPIILNLIIFTIVILDLFIQYPYPEHLSKLAKSSINSDGSFAFNIKIDEPEQIIVYEEYSMDKTIWRWNIIFKNGVYEKNEMFKFASSKYDVLDIYIDGVISNNPNVQNLNLNYFKRFVTYTNKDLDRLFNENTFSEGIETIERIRESKKLNLIEIK